ncbi:MAG: hypothetical protein JJT85_13050 [Chromatiales bacterium]|nr:hypothetical protein [Chromatiales bacterium]
MNSTAARYEYRAFAPNFGLVEPRMRALAEPPQIRESAEVYIVSASCTDYNIKIRENQFDVKRLLRVERGLQQWTVVTKLPMPATAGELCGHLAVLGRPLPGAPSQEHDAESLLRDIIVPAEGLVPVRVFKRRFGFRIADCLCELAEVTVNGAGIQTAAVESEQAGHALDVISTLGLDAYENTSYTLALRRITGLAPLAG